MSKKLYEILENINSTIDENYREYDLIGGLVGVSGLALFQYSYGDLLNSKSISESAEVKLINCVEKFNKGKSTTIYSSGASGMGWVFDYLSLNKFIDFNVDDFLSRLDQHLLNEMKKNFQENYYDFLHGGIGYGMYFLKRFESSKSENLKNSYIKYLSLLVSMIESISITEGEFIMWSSEINKNGTKEMGYNLGLSHGIPSIINFLSRLYRLGIEKEKSIKLINGGVKFITNLISKNKETYSLFPNWVFEGKELIYNSRIAWCYGDLGIGITLYKISKNTRNSDLEFISIKVLENCAKRKSPNKSKVIDAGLCHGSFGNAQIFNRLYLETRERKFKESADYWIQDGIKKSVFKDGYAGFKQWNGFKKDWQPDLSVLEGVSGIGLSIISYLTGENSWDECLLIG